MERFEHGGDGYAHRGAVDFSASLNPLGMPSDVRAALRARIGDFARYPDPLCRELTGAIAAYERVPASRVLATAGATDALHRLCQACRPRIALLCAPTYVGYEEALGQVGCAVRWHPLDAGDGFAVSEDLADAVEKGVEAVLLANPNNPTGRLLERGVLLRVLEAARAVGALVVLDECFVDLTEGARSNDLLADNPHLVIVKALTKSHTLAGLRVGYALSANEGMVAMMRAAGQPWAVSVPAQVAGVAALASAGYLATARSYIAAERARLASSLAGRGLDVVPSDANYLLFRGPRDLAARFLACGILIRSCDNFQGLGEGWYRVAVRTEDENDRLIAALEDLLPGGSASAQPPVGAVAGDGRAPAGEAGSGSVAVSSGACNLASGDVAAGRRATGSLTAGASDERGPAGAAADATASKTSESAGPRAAGEALR